MRILFPYMARWHAVNWTRYHSLLCELANRGHEIHVLQPPMLDSEETNFQEIAPVDQPNLTLHDVSIPSILWETKFPKDKLVKKATFSLAAYKQAKAMVNAGEIDVVLLYNIPQYFFSGLSSAVQIFDYADDYIDMLEQELGKFAVSPVLSFAQTLLHRMMKRADITLSVSHELAKQGIGRCEVLANGVGASKSQLSTQTDVTINNEGKPVVGFIGSFEYFIDFDVIVEAAEKLPDIHFLLVGSGRDWKDVQQKVLDKGLSNVEMTGGVPHGDVFKYISTMDVCLNIFKPIPVSHRACPLKLFEYMSLKKPVISTRLHELEYIDKDFLYYADTGQELVESIQAVMDDPDLAQKRAMQGYDETLENYTWEKLAEKFEELIDSLPAKMAVAK